MSDVRARITEALMAQFSVSREIRDNADNITGTLLSLPGIAIMDIETIEPVAEAIWSEDRCGIRRCPRKAFGWENVALKRQEVYRRMARAALLAAANAAEQATQ